jgi:hypothetical protein
MRSLFSKNNVKTTLRGLNHEFNKSRCDSGLPSLHRAPTEASNFKEKAKANKSAFT